MCGGAAGIATSTYAGSALASSWMREATGREREWDYPGQGGIAEMAKGAQEQSAQGSVERWHWRVGWVECGAVQSPLSGRRRWLVGADVVTDRQGGCWERSLACMKPHA
eukprot:2565679-Prymnesium_polylepis.1